MKPNKQGEQESRGSTPFTVLPSYTPRLLPIFGRRLLPALAFLLIPLLLASGAPLLPPSPDLVSTPMLDAMGNPSAVYCSEMGYRFESVRTAEGERGVCHLPGGVVCDAWDYLEGSCGQDYSLCAQLGYSIQVRNDGRNPHSRSYGVCVTGGGREVGDVSTLFNLPEKSQGCQGRSGAPIPFLEAAIEDPLAPPKDASLPASFDWRDYEGSNWLSPIKNQSMCGSCWAFSAVGTTEAAHNIAESNPNLDLNLSEEYLVSDCDTASGDCCGGIKSWALEFIRDEGIPDEACMPYVDNVDCTCSSQGVCSSNCSYSSSNTCSDATCSDRCADWESRLVHITDTGRISGNRDAIKNALVEIGPLSVSMYYGGYWDGDIYRCDPEPTYTNHAVVLVGYDDPGEYWIVRNSWGSSWNGDGYFLMGYGECLVESWVYYARASSTPPPSNDDFDSPISIDSMPFSATLDEIGATSDGDDPVMCTGYKHNNTVWYTYTPPASGSLTIDTLGSSYDTVLAVWTGSRASLSEVDCNDDFDSTVQSSVELTAAEGTVYHIEVADYYGSGGILQLNASFVPDPPDNDDFDSASVLSSLPFEDYLDTSAATSSGDDPTLPCTGAKGDNSVWYSYTPGLNGTLSIDTLDSDYDTALGVWTGSRGSLANAACNDDAPSSSQSALSLDVSVGTTYYIEAVDAASGGGNLDLNISFATAENDDFDSPTAVSSMPYSATQDTRIANSAGDDPTFPCAADAGDNSVWYRYTPTQDGTLDLDTFGSDYDTVLGVWTGERGSLTNVACNDDAPASSQSSASLEVTAGTDYHIEIADASTGGGDLQLNAAFTPAPGFTWYLAEGYTGDGFQTFILIQNPNPEEATVDVTYMIQGGGTVERQVAVGANSRFTIVAHDAGQVGLDAAFSTKLEASQPIVVERAMYWPNGESSSAGHVTIGVQQPMTTWYLAEGYTGGGFGTFILVQNPNPGEAEVTVTYMLQGGGTEQRPIVVAANSRYTIVAHDPGQVGLDAAFSTKLVANKPIIVERAMYFNNDGHAAVGVSAPDQTWYLAEGYTGGGFGTFILVQNPNDSEANVNVTYMLQGGGIEERAISVGANSRSTIVAHDPGQVGVDAAFSTKLEADQPIIVERAMYWPSGTETVGGHNSPAVSAPASTWSLAEGFTGGGFTTFILVQNPGESEASITVTYMLQGGGTLVREISVPANSRFTIEAHDEGQVGLDAVFSTLLESDAPIIVERAMYFSNGGHDTNGYVIP